MRGKRETFIHTHDRHCGKDRKKEGAKSGLILKKRDSGILAKRKKIKTLHYEWGIETSY